MARRWLQLTGYWLDKLHNSSYGSLNDYLLDILNDNGLSQMVTFSTRENSRLDIFITNSPSFIDNIKPIPGLSDHKIVYIESTLQIESNSRKIYVFNSGDWDSFKVDLENLTESFINSDSTDEHTWSSLRDSLLHCLNTHIPNWQSSKREQFPFITRRLKQLIRIGNRLYHLSKRTNSSTIRSEFKKFKPL